MEITCTRCHQAVREEDCFCPVCGLPQLTYASTDGTPAEEQQERFPGSVRDASMVEWRPALRWAVILAIPAALLSSAITPAGGFGMLWMATAAAWTVALYVRQQRVPWITIGAGARIGLVTGLIAGWLNFGANSCALFMQRVLLHQSSRLDSDWKTQVVQSQQLAEQWTSGLSQADAAQVQTAHTQIINWMQSPWGHAGLQTFNFIMVSIFLLFFALVGGAVGARLMGRTRPTEL